MMIDSLRLQIIPLSHDQMEKYIIPDALEKEMGLLQNNRVMTERIKTKIINNVLPNIKTESTTNLFYTFWVIILKAENAIAAEICLKGTPNEKGEVEIGYETFEDFRGKGIMPEAVGELAKWCFTNQTVKAIIAETDDDNIASQRTLKKNNFKITKTEPGNIVWRLEKLKHKTAPVSHRN
ncbi:GNAT family N-acetyltransferase [Flavobacterium amniphilum]|uniref:GNAT family N-acetyltransferase n=1 Tax=Flavobacterium amniphilum TaxID=1834035 RepID=UPI00202A1038|nr:GNAT family N-acetyltransferase [Flavobacterium amniphilum]MCL9805777.1 GNAT family N-acetyltransferase [Flavobacterium amniphilum]MCL9806364.1 GNAT family N-acetyltransferase [Flavobacterium amniphilum]